MSKTNRYLSIVLIIALTLGMWFVPAEVSVNENEETLSSAKDTICIWYTDEALTDYIDSAAFAFYDAEDVRVEKVLYEGGEYLEQLNEASLSGNQLPDLYILPTDSLEKAAMAGLAVPAEDRQSILSTLRYPQIALDSVTYQGQEYGYPFYYETAYLLYNETYLKQMATSLLLDGGSISDNEIPAGYTQLQWEEALEAKTAEMIPTSVEDILNFADQYTAPENVENIFTWDVNDIFYNYFFAGAYMNMGGTYGDDSSCIEIYNEDTIRCLEVYQGLNQFFSIDSDDSSYDKVLQDFMEGRTIFTIATTDAIRTLDNAIADGSFQYDYNVAALPGVDAEHSARGLSVTYAAVVNGFGTKREEANAFAKYLVYDESDSLLTRTGKMPATIGEDDYVTDARDLVRAVYRDSVALPKAMEMSNFWLELEQAYLKIWNGADANETLRTLSEDMKRQVTGQAVEEPVITVEETEDSSTEENTEEITEEITEDYVDDSEGDSEE